MERADDVTQMEIADWCLSTLDVVRPPYCVCTLYTYRPSCRSARFGCQLVNSKVMPKLRRYVPNTFEKVRLSICRRLAMLYGALVALLSLFFTQYIN